MKVISKTDELTSMFSQWFQGLKPFADNYQTVLEAEKRVSYAALLFAAFAGTTLFLPLRININEFSLHHFYKNRLVRCYLGASNAKARKPSRLTGFDPQDDIGIATLRAGARQRAILWAVSIGWNRTQSECRIRTGAAGTEGIRVRFQAALLRIRAAAFFEGSGYHRDADSRMAEDGYIATAGYMGPNGPDIGTTMAISGPRLIPTGDIIRRHR